MKMPDDKTIKQKFDELLMSNELTANSEKIDDFKNEIAKKIKWSIKRDQENLSANIKEKNRQKKQEYSQAEQSENERKRIETARQEKRKSHYIHVWLSNIVCSGAHGLSLNEKRIIMLAATRLQPNDSTAKKVPPMCIHTSDMISNYGITRQEATRALQEAGGIMKRKVIINNESQEKGIPPFGETNLTNTYIKLDRVIDTGEHIVEEIQWVTKSIYHEKEGWLELEFNLELLPLLTVLHANYTHYGLDKIKDIGSLYSWRLFELLYQYKSIGKRKFNIDEFNFILELPETYTKNFAHTEKRVILQAQNDLKVIFPFKYNLIKRGRKVSEIMFTFKIIKENQD
jgi:hypothetical protein